MMVKEGVVMSDHNSKRSRSPNHSRSPSEQESESPCEGDLLVVRRMLGHVSKPFDESQRESEEVEIIVNKQVLIAFSIGKYKNEVLCDVVPMEVTHILLGRPWQYDRKILHDCLTNKISFTFHGHRVTLKSLSPKEVHENQLKMKNKR